MNTGGVSGPQPYGSASTFILDAMKLKVIMTGLHNAPVNDKLVGNQLWEYAQKKIRAI